MDADAAEHVRDVDCVALGADVVLDFVGVDGTLRFGASIARSLGHLTLVGIGGGTLPIGFFTVPYELSVATTYWGSIPELIEVIALAQAGKIHARVQRFSLDDAPRAYELMLVAICMAARSSFRRDHRPHRRRHRRVRQRGPVRSSAQPVSRATPAPVVAVCAVGLLAAAASRGMHREINEHLEGDWTERAPLPGVRMHTELRDGNPVQVLLAVADEVDADLIVVGSRGFGGFPDLLLGSTSTQLAQHSRRPVLIVPMPTREMAH